MLVFFIVVVILSGERGRRLLRDEQRLRRLGSDDIEFEGDGAVIVSHLEADVLDVRRCLGVERLCCCGRCCRFGVDDDDGCNP